MRPESALIKPGSHPDPTHYSHTDWYAKLIEQNDAFHLSYDTFTALGFDHICTYYFASGFVGDTLLADWIVKKRVYKNYPENVNGLGT